MNRITKRFGGANTQCAIWIALCFSATSMMYLAWLYRLMDGMDAVRVDAVSMVAGYASQAAGIGLGCLLLRKSGVSAQKALWAVMLLFVCMSVPAVFQQLTAAHVFGLGMNLLCGIIVAFYLFFPCLRQDVKNGGTVFGAGYALSTLSVWLLSLLDGGKLFRGHFVVPITGAAACIACVYAGRRGLTRMDVQETQEVSPQAWVLPVGAVFLMSLVKNLGFGFPASDLTAGLPLELSRLFYALGLVVAGIVCDRKRQWGGACTLVALAMPFLMMALSGSAEKVPAFALWSLDYLFYGFFSVYRVVLFWDLARERKQFFMAPLGLLTGRLGDAAGTGIYLLLRHHSIWLLSLAMVLFIIAAFVLLHLFQTLYAPKENPVRSEHEVFESFSVQHDLSAREREVLRLILAEKTNAEIAQALYVTESTAKYHVHNILRKSGVKSRMELIAAYARFRYPDMRERRREGAEVLFLERKRESSRSADVG